MPSWLWTLQKKKTKALEIFKRWMTNVCSTLILFGYFLRIPDLLDLVVVDSSPAERACPWDRRCWGVLLELRRPAVHPQPSALAAEDLPVEADCRVGCRRGRTDWHQLEDYGRIGKNIKQKLVMPASNKSQLSSLVQ